MRTLTHTSIQPVDLPGTYLSEIHIQNTVILVWQDSHRLGGTDKESYRRKAQRLGESMRGATGHLCHFPYLAGPLTPLRTW